MREEISDKDNRMRVLLIDVNCKRGSTGKIVYDLYNRLHQTGNIAAIGYGRGPLIRGERIVKISFRWEVFLHAFLTRVTGMTGCFSYFATRKLIRLIDKIQPDVVHLHEIHGYYINIIPLINYLKYKDIKTVWTFHCEFMYTGKCGHAYDCEKWKTGCGFCGAKKEYPASLFFDFTAIMYRQKQELFKDFHNLTIVTPSLWLAERVRESFLLDKRMIVIHNGVDTEIFRPCPGEPLRRSMGIKPGCKVILSVAPDIMADRKGGKYILDLAKRLSDDEIYFILIGGKAEKRGNVSVLNRIEDQKKLAEYYSMADLFLICSQKETFSMTCAEALCCGTPVAGFCCGAPEMVFKEPYAAFVEYGDLDSLEKLVKVRLKGPDIGTECSKYARKEFSKEREFQEYLKVYLK